LQSHPHFSRDYPEARRKFLAAADAAGADIDSFRHPTERGPDGGPLCIDTAWFGSKDASTVVLALSGTHGAEGLCGSAAQIQWIDEGEWKRLPPGVAVLKVHAVNPFGFAHMLRVNESNVDLNRNWLDFDKPLPANPIYDEIHALLPTREGYDDELVDAFMSATAPLYKKHGDWAMSDALSRGQYRHPDGTQFGGVRTEWSTHALTYILKSKLAQARHVAYVDWHSLIMIGDGKFVYLCFNREGDHLHGRVASWWGAEAIDRRTIDKQWGDGVARSAGRPTRNGLVVWGLQHVLAPTADLAGAVIEFCANKEPHNDPLRHRMQQQLKARWLFRNRLHDTIEGRRVVDDLRHGACPQRRDWQDKSMEAAREAYAKILAGAGVWEKENAPPDPGVLTRSNMAA
jgi:hypothetical protein